MPYVILTNIKMSDLAVTNILKLSGRNYPIWKYKMELL